MADTQGMIERRRQELLGMGYPPGVVSAGMEWAVNSARGMNDYTTPGQQDVFTQMLPRFLVDAETYIKRMME